MITIFAFPDMLKSHIKDSNLKQPKDYNNYDPMEYPHFAVFMASHLCLPIDVGHLEDDANIIAAIPEEKVKKVTVEDLVELGMFWATDGDLI